MMLVTELLQESLCDALSHERMTWKRGWAPSVTLIRLLLHWALLMLAKRRQHGCCLAVVWQISPFITSSLCECNCSRWCAGATTWHMTLRAHWNTCTATTPGTWMCVTHCLLHYRVSACAGLSAHQPVCLITSSVCKLHHTLRHLHLSLTEAQQLLTISDADWSIRIAVHPACKRVQVKSPNILLTGSNKPYAKLADLGLARMPAVYAASMMDDTLKGTFAWLAPELILNTMNHEVSEKADMYSFGVVLWGASRLVPASTALCSADCDHAGACLSGCLHRTLRLHHGISEPAHVCCGRNYDWRAAKAWLPEINPVP